ncbi:3841_t:CDS:2, partial [Racocetra persica]
PDTNNSSTCLENIVNSSQVILKSIIECSLVQKNADLNDDTLFTHFGVSNKMNNTEIVDFSQMQVPMTYPS